MPDWKPLKNAVDEYNGGPNKLFEVTETQAISFLDKKDVVVIKGLRFVKSTLLLENKIEDRLNVRASISKQSQQNVRLQHRIIDSVVAGAMLALINSASVSAKSTPSDKMIRINILDNINTYVSQLLSTNQLPALTPSEIVSYLNDKHKKI